MEDNKRIEYLRRLLNVVVMEAADIEDGNLDKIGEYILIKRGIMSAVGQLDGLTIDSDDCNEIKSLIVKIQNINEESGKALLVMREMVKNKMAGLHASNRAHKAYFHKAIADGLEGN